MIKKLTLLTALFVAATNMSRAQTYSTPAAPAAAPAPSTARFTLPSQSSVTIYGIVDEGVASVRGGASGTVVEVESGAWLASRIGFKGVEDLGDGYRSLFVLENGFNANDGISSQSKEFFGRQAYVGLGGPQGTVTLGRIYTPLYLAVDTLDLDPVSGIGGGSDNIFPRGGVRLDNTVEYRSPTEDGFYGVATYTLGGVAGSTTANRTIGSLLAYESNPVTVALATNDTHNATGMVSARNTFLGGSYNFGPLTAIAAYQMNRADDSTVHNSDTLVGMVVPFGVSIFGVSAIKVSDQGPEHNDALQLALSYRYALSKRTSLYTSYTHIHNRNPLFFVTAEASGNIELNVGVMHKF